MPQPFQRRNHLAPSGQACAAGVGVKLAIAAEPHHHQRSQEPKQEFHDKAGEEVTDTGAAPLAFGKKLIDGVTDYPSQKDHKSIQHPLQQTQRDHVAVGDVADFMAQHRFRFLGAHLLQQAGADRHQRGIAAGAGGEGIGFR